MTTTLYKLAERLPIKHVYGSDVAITGMEMDNRNLKQGDLFFCIPGYTVDGHTFAESAKEAGAAAIVTERRLNIGLPEIVTGSSRRAMAVLAADFYGHPSAKLTMIGVTGTNGKTSVTHYIEQLLEMRDKACGVIGTMYTRYAGKTVASANTTPESITLQKLLHNMSSAGTETVAMEVSSHALAGGRIHGTAFQTAVFTNLSQDHLDYHKDMDDYAHAKSLLFSQLGSSFNRYPLPVSVINSDDPYASVMIRASAVPVVTYGIHSEADLQASDLKLDPSGSQFRLNGFGESYPIRISLPGRFSVYNVLAAAGALYAQGIELRTIAADLENLKGVRGRFEPVESVHPVHVIVDYAHTPDSLENVLDTIKEVSTGDVITVVGCGGDRDKTKRPLMAAAAEARSSLTILTSDNPRSEDPDAILEDMKQGMSSTDFLVESDRREAIRKAILHAKAGDVVLIAGKGHETYQEINGVRTEFDDRKEAETALKEWGY
ncbi:UDP-N-acetylmuramoyl-L-alanyl-D-glutamate--2,6-diaminopimelate ligase [Alkalicoccus luteus]|uniref:UDP-N-acetylmuramoyl-L-alanyl-D-glutamate--2, 6-diaminopimelate ligase n=1 Tax=Alkalicoccus luteus TaxID=1237094 RepID=UPI0040345FA9